jgi:CRP-like cAMP-binding protein
MPQCNHTSNHFLASLDAADLALIQPHLRMVELPQETVLFEAGDTIQTVYFLHKGVTSIVVDLSSGETIEAGMIGLDGVVGGASALDGAVSLNRAVVQIAGAASALNAKQFSHAVEQSRALRAMLNRHEHFLFAQAQQSAACNVSHALEARLARWLLRCRDLLHSEDLALTQEFLADMLGVTRTSVTLVANTLQQAGLIRYRRGHIRIVNVDRLKVCACECYAKLRAHSARLLSRTDGA